MKKKILALLLACVMVFALAACGSTAGSNPGTSAGTSSGSSGSSSGSSSGATDGTKESENVESATVDLHDKGNIDNSIQRAALTVSWNAPTSIAPWGTTNNVAGNYEVYEMLFETSADGEFFALLADPGRGEFGGYDHEAGTGDYTVYIYDYIYDHQGNHITASDVAWSYMYQYENSVTSHWDDLVNVEAKDDTTVVFHFSKEQLDLGALENFLTRCFIVSENCTANLDTEMCGTGPYKFVSYTSGASLVIEKNDNYWQKEELRRQESQANVGTITYQFVNEGSSIENGLKSGALDMSYDVKQENLAPFKDGSEYADNFNIYSFSQKFVYYLNPNCSSGRLTSDVNLRMAIYYAIDQDGLVTALGDGYVRLWAYVSDYYSDYGFVDWAGLDNYNTKQGADLAKSKEYLDKSGYNGESLVFVCGNNFSNEATILIAQLQAAGIKCEMKGLDQASQQATIGDENAWDLWFGMMAGDYNVQVWSHDFDYSNVGGGHTQEFLVDDEWQSLLALCNTAEGHTPENMLSWWQHAVDNAYTMGLYTGLGYNVVPEDCTYVCLSDRLVLLPGACCYNGSV